MAEHADDARRAMCDELARLLASPDGLRQARLMQLVKVLSRPATTDDEPAGDLPGDEAPIPIGVWRPQEIDGRLLFVRPDPLVMGDPWDPRKTLTPKTSFLPLRVCLLGESTAAGWFYAPHLTPARVLEDQLGALKGPGVYEVLNLACVDQSADELVRLARAAVQLKPDIFVVFAGNNWPVQHDAFPDTNPALSQDAALAFHQDGARGLMRSLEHTTRQVSEAVLAQLVRVADAAGIEVILVIPEVNLADWERARPVSWLPGDGTARWHRLYQQALSRLSVGGYEEAETAARRMIELDRGTCAASYRVLANALLAQGRGKEGRDACLGELDCRAWDNFPYLPGATTAVRDVLREGARRNELSLVDLPSVFQEHAGQVPGRRLFLDYCHLTLEGMKVAMVAIAAEVLRLSEAAADATDWKTLLVKVPDPAVPAEVDAHAKFMTGLYHAHWNPRSGGAQYWFEQARQAWNGIEDTMRAYIATRGAPPESVLFSVAQQRIFRSAQRLERRIWNVPNLDAEAIDVMCGILERSGRSRPTETFRGGLNAAVRPGGVDLLNPMYHWSINDLHASLGSFANSRCLYYRALWPTSHFCLVSGQPADVRLELTGRLPGAGEPRTGTVSICLNGVCRCVVDLHDRWSSHTLTLARDHLREGINRLTLEWPSPPPVGDSAIREAVQRLEQGIPTDLHPVFGELFRLVARRGVRGGDGARAA